MMIQRDERTFDAAAAVLKPLSILSDLLHLIILEEVPTRESTLADEDTQQPNTISSGPINDHYISDLCVGIEGRS